ncbi:hypothetical protein [Flavobacterium silvisoli]|uniref:hypothetical protein n=1 Tax=Flavobacterium silvisoli TaxID=2529433 RepID=UPI0012B65EB0|nr:hypothetical protein [Flavobacterium silvisoli]
MKTENQEWKVDCNRYIGFMDVMGFKDMVARKSHEEVGRMLHQMSFMKDILQRVIVSPLKEKNEMFEREERVKSITFSDSVLFVTKDDSLSDLLILSSVLEIFQEAAIQRGAPTKGAISFGRLTADFEKSLFYGQPLIDAYLLQDQLNYYGIIVDNEAEARIIDSIRREQIDESLIKGHFYKLATPLKSGKVQHYNVRLGNLTEEQIEDMYKTVSGGVRKYVDNTIEIYELMNKNSS